MTNVYHPEVRPIEVDDFSAIAYLDNFVLKSVTVPEPATPVLLTAILRPSKELACWLSMRPESVARNRRLIRTQPFKPVASAMGTCRGVSNMPYNSLR